MSEQETPTQHLQLSPAITLFLFDSGTNASLHFSWDKKGVFEVKKSGTTPINDIRDAISEMETAMAAMKKMISDGNLTAPKTLIVATPTRFLTLLLPQKYLESQKANRYRININEYMQENEQITEKEAWLHFIDTVLEPNLTAIKARFSALTNQRLSRYQHSN